MGKTGSYSGRRADPSGFLHGTNTSSPRGGVLTGEEEGDFHYQI